MGVPGDGGRREKVQLRLMGEEVCKEGEGRNNERERKRGKGGLQEWVRQRNV